MKALLTVATTTLALALLAGCGGDDGGDETTAQDTGSTESSPTSTPTDPPTPGSYPAFEPEDYTFVLEQVCFCPLTGPVRVTVEDGEIVEAVVIKGGRGVEKGSDAPPYLRMTINDVIDKANDPEADSVDVMWPDGQDYPSKVSVDAIEKAVDDEVTYLVRNVTVG
jgi:hypothetical protein